MSPKKESTIILDYDASKVSKQKRRVLIVDLNKNKIPLRDGSVDKVHMHHVLEHLEPSRIEFVLRDIFRIMKPRTEFYISVPNSLQLIYRFEYLFGLIPDDFILWHKSHFTFQSLERLLLRTGFKIPKRKNKHLFIPFKDLLLVGIWLRARKADV